MTLSLIHHFFPWTTAGNHCLPGQPYKTCCFGNALFRSSSNHNLALVTSCQILTIYLLLNIVDFLTLCKKIINVVNVSLSVFLIAWPISVCFFNRSLLLYTLFFAWHFFIPLLIRQNHELRNLFCLLYDYTLLITTEIWDCDPS